MSPAEYASGTFFEPILQLVPTPQIHCNPSSYNYN